MNDVERVVAAMAQAWDTVPDTGTVADMRHALARAAMRETRLIDAEALREDACCIGYGNDDVIRGAKLGADWLKGRAA